MSNKRVVIVGGGIIGAACAYYLARTNWSVTVIDRDEFGRACSHANCGLIAPSHVLPLNEPGAIKQGVKAFFSSNSPLKIRPQLDPSVWAWFFKFAMRCNRRDMLDSARARTALLQSSAELYPQLFARESLDPEYEQHGCLFVYETQRAMDKYANENQLVQEHFGHAARRIDAAQLAELEPALRDGLPGAWLHESDSHLRPDVLMTQWRSVLENMGVTILEHHHVTGFATDGAGRASAVKTHDTEVPADAVVVATGALTPFLKKHLGCRIPIQPGKGYSITMPRPEPCVNTAIIFPEHSVVLTPMRSGFRIGSTMEFTGYDDSINPKRLALLTQGARRYLRQKP
ncbi:MAG: NAD(P)/FAD-dependent oxidoreductase, partial [Planctomycetota bacterium]